MSIEARPETRLKSLIQPNDTAVELYLKAGMNLACFEGCPVNWYKNHCTNYPDCCT
jgi:hypothetical protein